MTRAAELPPGTWKCHGNLMLPRAACPKCGYRRAEELPAMLARLCESVGIDTSGQVKTRVEPQSGGKGPNKLEARYNAERLSGAGRYEGITFRLANGHRYTPDLVTSNELATVCHEVKDGRYRQHSYQRARLAFDQARVEYPSIGFVWCEWTGKEWVTK